MDLSYTGVRAAHVAFVAMSIALFVLRMAWRERAPVRLARRWVKVVPHVVDTALLLSGAWLAWQLGGTGVRGWLPAKLVGVVIYIVLGNIALRRGRSRRVRLAAAVAALLTVGYIVSVALTKSSWGLVSG